MIFSLTTPKVSKVWIQESTCSSEHPTTWSTLISLDSAVSHSLTQICCWTVTNQIPDNASVPQNVTFGYQDELLGIHGAGSALKISWIGSMIVALLTTLFVMV